MAPLLVRIGQVLDKRWDSMYTCCVLLCIHNGRAHVLFSAPMIHAETALVPDRVFDMRVAVFTCDQEMAQGILLTAGPLALLSFGSTDSTNLPPLACSPEG
jgi:hypothetical protein